MGGGGWGWVVVGGGGWGWVGVGGEEGQWSAAKLCNPFPPVVEEEVQGGGWAPISCGAAPPPLALRSRSLRRIYSGLVFA